MLGIATKPLERPTLFTHYKMTLETQIERFMQAHAADQAMVARINAIKASLADSGDAESWSQLYRAELELAELLPQADIAVEFARRAVEAERFKVPTLAKLQAEFDAATEMAGKRAAFRCLLEDLLWTYNKRALDREQRGRAAKRLAIIGGFAIPTILLLLLVSLYLRGMTQLASSLLVFVMLPGMLGAFFSRLLSFQTELATLDYDRIITYFLPRHIFIRLIIGAVGAVTLYLVFLGSLLSGAMFPDINIINSSLVAPNGVLTAKPFLENLGKLMFWSFVAGFSERLVTSTLGRLEGQAISASLSGGTDTQPGASGQAAAPRAVPPQGGDVRPQVAEGSEAEADARNRETEPDVDPAAEVDDPAKLNDAGGQGGDVSKTGKQ